MTNGDGAISKVNPVRAAPWGHGACALAALIACAGGTPPRVAPAVEPAPLVVLAANPVATGVHAVPIACVLDGVVRPGAECRDAVGAGTVATVPLAGLTALGAPTTTRCAADDRAYAAWEAAVVVPDASSWGHTGQIAPAGPALVEEAPPPAVVEKVAALRGEWGPSPQVTVVLAGELDGVPGDERVVRVFRASDDVDKPGNSALYVDRDGAALAPLAPGDPLNGVADLLAAPSVPGGHLLVVRSSWSGGVGLHAFLVSAGGSVRVGEFACGS